MGRKSVILLFEELRKRLIIIALTVFAAAVVCFMFSEEIRHILLLPGAMVLPGFEAVGFDMQLIFLTPSEAFLANMRLAVITGATVTLPIILYQCAALALTVAGKVHRAAVWLTLAMYVLFVVGLSFAYFVVLPFTLNFFIGFSSADLVPRFSVARYITFATTFLFSFGLVFQLPLIFWFMGSIGLVNAAFLRHNRKFALLFILIFAAILTPPDIFSQVLMAVPLLLLYELGIILVSLTRRKPELL
ncbi:MAG TPA: twin-arginine translocase subunit TatC [Candidatus Limnocylindrales bacterium]|nr:twin-arginine translocase subunit TatC [Candidatus Limnocylindrales bacterium]